MGFPASVSTLLPSRKTLGITIRKPVDASRTVLDLWDSSGKTIRRVVIPKGFRSTQQLLYKARTGEVDVTQWGYSSVDKLEEVINNVNKYLNRGDLKKAPALINSEKAGDIITLVNGETIAIDPIGLPIYRGSYVKADLNISTDSQVLKYGLAI